MFFLVIGAVSATDYINVSNTEDSNLIGDNDDSLSANDKLEISNEVSVSQTNIVNSHDDYLGNYPDDEALNISADLDYKDNIQKQSASNDIDAAGENTLSSTSSSADSVVADSSSDDVVSADSSTQSNIIAAGSISTKLSVSDTHYGKSATYFDVKLTDNNGKILINQKVTLNVNKKSYSAFTNNNGIASVKTDSLKIGSYTVSLNYGGNSNYSSSSLSKKVNVLSSVVGSDLTKFYGYSSKYKVTFWEDSLPLANTKVNFKVNGKTYTRTTNQKGVASLDISLPVGKYTISMTNPYSKEQVSHKIVVKKAKTKFSAAGKTYIHTNNKGSFSVVLKTVNNQIIKNKKITFTYNNKKVTSKTNANGKATITIPVLAKGTYKISFKYDGNNNFYSKSGDAKLVVANPTTKLASKILVMKYNDGSKFKVNLKDSNGNNLANKDIKFTIKGKSVVSKTNRNGDAKLSLKNINPGNHVVKYSYLTPGLKDYSHGSNRVIIFKLVGKISAKDLTMNHKDGSKFKVTVKSESGKVIRGVFVKFTIGSKSYVYQTDSNGVAKLDINKGVGKYSIKSILADPHYKSAPVTKNILVKGTKFVAGDAYASTQGDAVYSVKLVNEKNKPVANKNVVFTFKGKNLSATTNSNGYAKVKLGVLSKGTHSIDYEHGLAHGSSKIYVINKVTIKNILKASKSVVSYVSKHSKLPSSVKIGTISFKTADYLYLASKTIVNLKAGNKKDIPVKIIDNPNKSNAASNLGYLKDYLGVAKSIVKTAESKGKAPNSVSSNVGTIGYKGVVFAFSKVLKYYDNNKRMPSYVDVTSLSSTSSSSTGVLNSKNTIKNLAAYLAASMNCEVNNAKIKKLVSKLTKDCKSDREKANVIFNYVRDTVSYSFYYDTKFGAVGTLNAKTGNCVDHAHLLVAMYRAAGLAARYVHGSCTFSSGSTFGHVWSQVLIGNTWTVADATSSRNSLGNVANWNSNSYHLNGYYSSIQF